MFRTDSRQTKGMCSRFISFSLLWTHYMFAEVGLLANCHLIYRYFILGAAYAEVEQEIAPWRTKSFVRVFRRQYLLISSRSTKILQEKLTEVSLISLKIFLCLLVWEYKKYNMKMAHLVGALKSSRVGIS